MEFLGDTAILDDISELNDHGLLDGVTTNPSLIARSGRDLKDTIAEICGMVSGPVSAEVAATDFGGMVAEGERLGRIADNVTVKLPLTLPGLKAWRHFTAQGVRTNVTPCFIANLALLAAKAGATDVSPFLGRLDDINIDGMQPIRDMRAIFDNHGFTTRILAAAIRSGNHVKDAALAGADTATMPPAGIRSLASHP